MESTTKAYESKVKGRPGRVGKAACSKAVTGSKDDKTHQLRWEGNVPSPEEQWRRGLVVGEATCGTTEPWWKLLPSLCGYAWVVAWASFLLGEDPGDGENGRGVEAVTAGTAAWEWWAAKRRAGSKAEQPETP